MKRLASLAALALAAASACALPHAVTERSEDGIFHITCKGPLPRCLVEAEEICNHERYAVLRAFDMQDYKGNTAQPESFRSSEAFIRCGTRGGWGDDNNALRKEPICSETPRPTTVCTAGASVACVGPAGCHGGQMCLPDGSKLGPCDCGPAAPAPAPPTPAP
jgi:hypothetical protein